MKTQVINMYCDVGNSIRRPYFFACLDFRRSVGVHKSQVRIAVPALSRGLATHAPPLRKCHHLEDMDWPVVSEADATGTDNRARIISMTTTTLKAACVVLLQASKCPSALNADAVASKITMPVHEERR